jgi:hypothetical protein
MNDMKKYIKLSVCFLILAFATLSHTLYRSPVHAQTVQRFGTGVVLLDPPPDGIHFVGKLSPDGNYVAAILENAGTLSLWDLRDIDPDGPAVIPEPDLYT